MQDADVKVFYDSEKEKWAVQSVGAKQVDSYHRVKNTAVERAKEIAKNKDTDVITEKKNEN